MIAFNSFSIQKASNKFSLDITGKLTITEGSFDFLNASYINVRLQPCEDTKPYYL